MLMKTRKLFFARITLLVQFAMVTYRLYKRLQNYRKRTTNAAS